MKTNSQKFIYRDGYGHCGIQVNLSLADEYAIAQMLKTTENISSRLKGVGMDIPETLPIMSEAQAALSQVSTLLKKMTTIDLVESDLFSEQKTEEGE